MNIRYNYRIYKCIWKVWTVKEETLKTLRVMEMKTENQRKNENQTMNYWQNSKKTAYLVWVGAKYSDGTSSQTDTKVATKKGMKT